jgi:hypothetical protein
MPLSNGTWLVIAIIGIATIAAVVALRVRPVRPSAAPRNPPSSTMTEP